MNYNDTPIQRSHLPARRNSAKRARRLLSNAPTPRMPAAKQRGQVAIIIALSMVALIAVLGLAIDGGSIYAQRRTAQNSSDAAALAGTRVMLDGFDAMILANPEDVDGD